MTIHEMTAEDIPSVVELDNLVFSMKWDEKSFTEELKKDYSYYFVAAENGKITGFAGVWCVYETADIAKIAVDPDMRKCGIGSALLKALISKSEECGCEEMMLEVRQSNTAAQCLYKKYGFEEIGIRKGYYNGENAVIMKLILKGVSSYNDG